MLEICTQSNGVFRLYKVSVFFPNGSRQHRPPTSLALERPCRVPGVPRVSPVRSPHVTSTFTAQSIARRCSFPAHFPLLSPPPPPPPPPCAPRSVVLRLARSCEFQPKVKSNSRLIPTSFFFVFFCARSPMSAAWSYHDASFTVVKQLSFSSASDDDSDAAPRSHRRSRSASASTPAPLVNASAGRRDSGVRHLGPFSRGDFQRCITLRVPCDVVYT